MYRVSSYFTYIIVFGIFPIIGVASFSYGGYVPKEYEGLVRGLILLPVIGFLGIIQFVPQKQEDYDKISYKNVNRSHLALDVIRRAWVAVSFLTFIIYGLQILYVVSVSKNYFEAFPSTPWVPIVAFSSLLWFLLAHTVYGYWDRNQYFRLRMAREKSKEISKSEDRFERMKVLTESLLWYEKYIKIALSIELGNIQFIISRIIAQPSDKTDETIKSFIQAFTHNDRLQPLRELSKHGALATPSDVKESENTTSKLKELELILALIGSALAIIGYVISLFVGKS